jgi:sarcosine oxidase / L-pipecolate oxidase
MTDVVIAGAGVVGASTALELRRRGASVTLLEPGPVPHPDAASTDISKLIRADYGRDVFYTELMETALVRWRSWNARWGTTLFHETGMLVLSKTPFTPESFEGASFETLTARGHRLERLDGDAIAERFPDWARGRYVDGYFNPQGGWAESGRVVEALYRECREAGVTIVEGVRLAPLAAAAGRVEALLLESGERVSGGAFVIAAGAFTAALLPELADRLVPVGQPVFHFEAPASGFTPPSFLPWAADIGTTGWYGFPAHAGVVKIANHGAGKRVDPREPRAVGPEKEALFRRFLREALPALASRAVVRTRLCLYCDAFDGDFFIGRHPAREGLVVAAGGSGHAFKFAPVLGDIVADAVQGVENAASARFGFRERGAARREEARASS